MIQFKFKPIRTLDRSWEQLAVIDDPKSVKIRVEHKKTEFNVFTGKKDIGGIWVYVTVGEYEGKGGYAIWRTMPMADTNYRFLAVPMERFNKKKFEEFAQKVLRPEVFELYDKQQEFYIKVKSL